MGTYQTDGPTGNTRVGDGRNTPPNERAQVRPKQEQDGLAWDGMEVAGDSARVQDWDGREMSYGNYSTRDQHGFNKADGTDLEGKLCAYPPCPHPTLP